MNHYEALKKLSPIQLGDNFDSDLQIEGKMFDSAMDAINSILSEISPSTATSTLSRWEREWGIIQNGSEINARRNAILAKLRLRTNLQNGGLREQIFINIADGLGYEISIIESGEMFRAGISKAGDPVFSSKTLWVWTVVVHGESSAPALEELFNDIKPPYTRINFEYV
jgi:uncharacterized protein YmfQ (DUF2313 family)